MSNIFYSYTDFVKERKNFKVVDSESVNRFDTPSAIYYKIIFYFTEDQGLLGLNNIIQQNEDNVISNLKPAFTRQSGEISKADFDKQGTTRDKNVDYYNTAYNYLMLNDETDRAEMLKDFIVLLSSINSDSPWYFQEISGLDAALERKLFSEKELKLEDKPRQITIKCLQDSFDNRIGTLLDLYRSACFSYQNKKEIVPANLRKFNMGILLFNAPIMGAGGKWGDKNTRIMIPETNEEFYIPNSKFIELRNCEIDYNSAKSPFGTLNTTENPFSPEYVITINYDDCYESRYNEFMSKVITDFINADLNKEGSSVDIHGNTYDYNKSDFLGGSKTNGAKTKWLDRDISTSDENLYNTQAENNGLSKEKRLTKRPPKWIEQKGYEYKVGKYDYLNEDGNNPQQEKESNPLASETRLPKRGSEDKVGKYDYLNDNKNFVKNERELNNLNVGFGGNLISSQVSKISSGIKDALSLPKIKSNNIDGNVHDLGTVNRYGRYEYLNRIDMGGGIVGGLISQTAGTIVDKAEDAIMGMYLGNIHGFSIGKMIDNAKRLLGGDFKGIIGDLKNNKPTEEQIEMKEEIWPDPQQRQLVAKSSKLPQYDERQTKLLGKLNKKMSIRNNI